MGPKLEKIADNIATCKKLFKVKVLILGQRFHISCTFVENKESSLQTEKKTHKENCELAWYVSSAEYEAAPITASNTTRIYSKNN